MRMHCTRTYTYYCEHKNQASACTARTARTHRGSAQIEWTAASVAGQCDDRAGLVSLRQWSHREEHARQSPGCHAMQPTRTLAKKKPLTRKQPREKTAIGASIICSTSALTITHTRGRRGQPMNRPGPEWNGNTSYPNSPLDAQKLEATTTIDIWMEDDRR